MYTLLSISILAVVLLVGSGILTCAAGYFGTFDPTDTNSAISSTASKSLYTASAYVAGVGILFKLGHIIASHVQSIR